MPSQATEFLANYCDSSSLSSTITTSLKKLTSLSFLPESPYSSLIPSLRLAESSDHLKHSIEVDSDWLRSVQEGTNSGAYNVQKRRQQRILSEPTPLLNITSLSLSPGYNGSVYGLSHVLKHVDAVGLAGVANVMKDLELILYPMGLHTNRKSEYIESMYYSILAPSVYHGQYFSPGELIRLDSQVDCVIKGPQFEKAVTIFSRRIMTEIFAADQANDSCVSICCISKTAARRKGDPDNTKKWTAEQIRTQKNSFVSAVKSSTVSHRSVSLELVMRTRSAKLTRSNPLSNAQRQKLEEAGKLSSETTHWKFVRVRRTFVMHYQDGKPKSATRTFAEFPGGVLATGVFLDPNGQEASEIYMGLFKSMIPPAKSAREKAVLTALVDMGKTEKDAAAKEMCLRKVTNGSSPESAIRSNAIFDKLFQKLCNDIRSSVKVRDDFSAFERVLPVLLLTGANTGLRDVWRMVCGIGESMGEGIGKKASISSSPAADMNRLRRDGEIISDVCNQIRETFLMLLKREKNTTNERNIGKKQSSRSLVHEKTSAELLESSRAIIKTIQNMFWRWSSDITNLAVAEASSDAAGLSAVLLSLLNIITDRTSREMRLPVFPSLVPVPVSLDNLIEEDDSDLSMSSESDESEGGVGDKVVRPSTLDERECKRFAESLRVNVKITKQIVGLLSSLERSSGLDVVGLCYQQHKVKVKEAITMRREEENKMRKVPKNYVNVDTIEKMGLFEQCKALNIDSIITSLGYILEDSSEDGSDLETMWNFDRQLIRAQDPTLVGKFLDVNYVAREAAKARTMYALPICKEAVIVQYLTDSRVDAALSACLSSVLTGALVTNPFPRFVSNLRPFAVQFSFRETDETLLLQVLGIGKMSKVAPSWRNPYAHKDWDSSTNLVVDDDDAAAKIPSPEEYSLKNDKVAFAVADDATGTLATHGANSQEVIYGSKESLVGIAPRVACSAIFSLLPKLIGDLKIPEGTVNGITTSAGFSFRTPHICQMQRLCGGSENEMPTFLKMQLEYMVEFTLPKQLPKISRSYAEFVIEIVLAIHDKFRHLVLGLCCGGNAHEWAGGRVRYNLAQLRSKKERSNILSTITHFEIERIALHSLFLVPDYKTPGSEKSFSAYIPTVLRFVLIRKGPGMDAGLKKSSPLPSHLELDPGMMFDTVYTNFTFATNAGSDCGRQSCDASTKLLLSQAKVIGKSGVDNKKKLLFERQRADFISILKEEIESNILSGNYLDSYSAFEKLCRFNVDSPNVMYISDPMNLDRDDEYIPSMITHVPSIARMCRSVAAELQRLLCVAISLGVLLEGKSGGAGLPVGYPQMSSDVISRISVEVIKKQADYFEFYLRKCLTSFQCVQLDGACRAVLHLLPQFIAAVDVVVARVSGGGTLYVDAVIEESSPGFLLAEIVQHVESVRLVSARDVHETNSEMKRAINDLSETDTLQ